MFEGLLSSNVKVFSLFYTLSVLCNYQFSPQTNICEYFLAKWRLFNYNKMHNAPKVLPFKKNALKKLSKRWCKQTETRQDVSQKTKGVDVQVIRTDQCIIILTGSSRCCGASCAVTVCWWTTLESLMLFIWGFPSVEYSNAYGLIWLVPGT